MSVSSRVLASVTRPHVLSDSGPHSWESESSAQHGDCPVYSPVTSYDWIMVTLNDFCNSLSWHYDFVIFPETIVLIAMLQLQLSCLLIEELLKDDGILLVILQPVVQW